MYLLLLALISANPIEAEIIEINREINQLGNLSNVCIFALDENEEMLGIPSSYPQFQLNACKPLPLKYKKPRKVGGQYVVDFNGTKVTSKKLVVTETPYNRAKMLYEEWNLKYSE